MSEEILGLEDDNQVEFLTLVSNDNQYFQIEKNFCYISKYIKSITELDSDKKEIQIDISGDLLKIIVDFMKYYIKQPFHRIQKPVPKDFQNSKFIHDEQENLFNAPFYTELLNDKTINFLKLVHIVNYLSIQPMLELVCARIANIVRDMTKEEEMKYLQISNEDYIEMKKTNEWAL